MNGSANDDYIYTQGNLTLIRNYVARISAFMLLQGRSLPKIKYNYIKS